MKISVITPTYNSSLTIAECIDSVNKQTYPDIEHIIVDGFSTDRTLETIKNIPNRITAIISEKDKGIYDAMNKGILLATGDIIGILNSDDLYPDDQVLNDVMKCFKEDPELDLLYGNLVYVRNDDINKIIRTWNSTAYHDHFFEKGHVPAHPTLFLRSTVYKEESLFNLNYKFAADYEFMLRIFKKHKFKSKYLKRLIVKMRMGGATNKHIINIYQGNREIIKAWKNNGLKAPLGLMPFRIINRLTQFIK